MWCRHCLREVNASSTGLSGGTCPLCGHKTEPVTRQTDAIRQAREILERWQSSDLFDRISSTESLPERKQQDTGPLPGLPLHRASSPSKNEATPLKIAPSTTESNPVPAATQSPGPAPSPVLPGIEPSRRSSSHGGQRILRPMDPLSAILGELIAPRPFLATAAPPAEESFDAHLPSRVVPATTQPIASAEAERPQVSLTSETDEATARLFSEHIDFDEISHHAESVSATTEPGVAAAEISSSMSDEPSDNSQTLDADGELSQDEPQSDVSEIHSSVEQLTESLPASAPSLLSIASIHEESNVSVPVSADSANHQQSTTPAAPMKTQRSPLKRPPLQRRVQSAKPPVNSVQSESGTDPMTKKFRIDVPGEQESLQESAPATGPINSSVAPETRIVSNSPKPGRRLRIDSAESLDDVAATDGRRVRTQGLPHHRYIDEPHGSGVRGPHFEVSTPRRSNLTSIIGQSLAYLGVLGLTIGTSMVIYGHFGGYAEYTPTGWLVTTVAQMLLFLGVINLVSGGIEQNNDEVSRRINTLGEQLVRIEQVTSEVLRGPKISPRIYADPEDAEAAESARETVGVERDRQ